MEAYVIPSDARDTADAFPEPVVVTRPPTLSLSWLGARVGRRVPVERTWESERRRTNARVRADRSTPALRPTVYLPSAPADGDGNLTLS